MKTQVIEGNKYLTISNHCINRVSIRNGKNGRSRKKRSCTFFIAGKFSKMYDLYIEKSSEVKHKYEGNGKYSLSEGEHRFIFSKPYKVEFDIITYINLKNNYL